MKALLLLCCTIMVSLQAEDPAQIFAQFSDPRPSVHVPATRALMRYGRKAVPDLGLLATDADADIRRRVARLLSSIGGPEAVDVLRRLLRDADPTVRSEAAIAIGGLRAPAALRDLQQLLRDPVAEVRDSSALALGLIPDPSSIGALLAAIEREGKLDHENEQVHLRSQRAYKSMMTSLTNVVGDRSVVPALSELIPAYQGTSLEIILRATWEIGDPRLCLPLTSIATSNNHAAARLAVFSLAANGDSRCIQALTQVASRAPDEELREGAAVTLRALTGYRAGPGQVWEIWWRDNGDRVRALFVRDTFIARCHRHDWQPSPADLQAFSVEELDPLIDGAIGAGAVYWPPVALAAIRRDDPARWRPYLLHRYRTASSERERVDLLALIDLLGIDGSLRSELQLDLERLDGDLRRDLGNGELRVSSERALLHLLLDG